MAGDWKNIVFGDVIINGTRNGVYKKKEFHGSGTKIVNMGELFAYSRLKDVPMKRVELTDSELEKSSLQPGDLLFARRSLVAEGAGKCTIVLEVNEPTTFESSIIRARPNPEEASSLFLYYLFNSPFGKYHLGTILRQVAVSGITGTDLAKLTFPLPPIKVQKAIAHILGTLDDKIELNRKMNETLEAMARAIFQSWFVDFDPVRAKAEGRDTGLPKHRADLFPDSFEDSELGEIPRGWRVKNLPDVIRVNPSRSIPKNQVTPYLDMGNMPTNMARALGFYSREFGSGMKFINGDTLVARITPCLENGKTCFVDFLDDGQTGWGSTEYIVLRPEPPLPPEFAYFLARTETFRSFAITNMTGTSGRQRVPAESLNQFKIVIPSDQIGKYFGKIANSAVAKMKANDNESTTLASLRDKLLPKLISGDLQIKDAEPFVEKVAI